MCVNNRNIWMLTKNNCCCHPGSAKRKWFLGNLENLKTLVTTGVKTNSDWTAASDQIQGHMFALKIIRVKMRLCWSYPSIFKWVWWRDAAVVSWGTQRGLESESSSRPGLVHELPSWPTTEQVDWLTLTCPQVTPCQRDIQSLCNVGEKCSAYKAKKNPPTCLVACLIDSIAVLQL